MNLAIVLDLKEDLSAEEKRKIRALLMALQKQHGTGDRFSLTAAGIPGGNLIKAGDFRYGTVHAALDKLFENRPDTAPLSLEQALKLPPTKYSYPLFLNFYWT